MNRRARILLITGPGKGKTTAALGIILRCLAHGRKTLLTRFCKATRSGELDILEALPGLTVLGGCCGMTPPADHPDFPRHAGEARRLFDEMAERAAAHDVVVLDEICGAVAKRLIPEERVLAFLAGLRPGQTAVLTGRDATCGLIAAADTVSEVLCLKHAYAKGVAAQDGIEW